MDGIPGIEADEIEDFNRICRAEGFDPSRFALRATSLFPSQGVAPIDRKIVVEWIEGGQIEHEVFEAGNGSTWPVDVGHMLRSGRVGPA